MAPAGNVSGCGCTAKHTTTDGYNDPVTHVLDGFGDVRTVTDPLGHVTTYTYDADQNLISQTDPGGQTTTYSYDDDNEQTTIHESNGTTEVTGYDDDGNVISQTDGNGNTTNYTFDPLGHELSSTNPLGEMTTYDYDAVGNLGSTTNPEGRTTSYTYNPANEVTSISYSGGTTPNVTGITYDADGQRIGMTDGTGTWSWNWDSLHRLTSVTEGTNGSVSYAYSLDDQPTAITYPNGKKVTDTYDSDGRMTAVDAWEGGTTDFNYDPDSNLTIEKLPSVSKVTDSFSYNTDDQLTSINDIKGSSKLFSTSYSYNANSLVVSDSSATAPNGPTYGYTDENQLCYAGATIATSCPAPATGADTYSYDAAGNLTQTPAGTQTFNAADELCWSTSGTSSNPCSTVPAGATSYRYDADGNLTGVAPASGSSTTIGYDQANQLTRYTKATTSATYSYSGDGLRMDKTVNGTKTAFAWDLSDNLPLLLQSGSTYYVYGPGGVPLEQIDGSTVEWLHHDQLGSTRLITSSKGTVLATFRYNPYGNFGERGGISHDVLALRRPIPRC